MNYEAATHYLTAPDDAGRDRGRRAAGARAAAPAAGAGRGQARRAIHGETSYFYPLFFYGKVCRAGQEGIIVGLRFYTRVEL